MPSTEPSSEFEGTGSNGSGPSPVASAYHTPRASISRRSSSKQQNALDDAYAQLTSAPSTNDDDPRLNDEEVIRDPRRFTPTLQASLISEILKLRGELDSRHNFIEELETSLEQARTEKDEVAEELLEVEKDRRTLRRQFQQLETQTLGALEELVKDRDDTNLLNKELKSKLDEVQEKHKKKSEESDRTHSAWEKERNAWDTERRAFERRVHITESRLKTVISELEATHQAHAQMQEQARLAEEDDNGKDSGLGDESDTASQASPQRTMKHQRSLSNSSRRSINRSRFSMASNFGPDGLKMTGVSLADELHLDEEEEMSEAESELHEPSTKRISVRGSRIFDEKHKPILQAPIEFDSPRSQDQPPHPENAVRQTTKVTNYVDLGIQATPPQPTPQSARQLDSNPLKQYCDSGVQYEPVEPEIRLSNPVDDRKDSKVDVLLRNGMTTPPILVDRAVSPIDSPQKSRLSMASSGSQTVEEPLSPPATPGVSPPLSPAEFAAVSVPRAELKSVSTQTESVERPYTPPPQQVYNLPIPAITITSPGSAPSSPGQPKLPPGTKNIAIQTGNDVVPMTSIGIQTEGIRMDLRLAKLPPHLHPSAITDSGLIDPKKARATIKAQNRSSLGSNLSDRSSVLRSPTPTSDSSPKSPTIHSPIPLKNTTTSRFEELQNFFNSTSLLTADDDAKRLDKRERGSEFVQTEPSVAGYATPSSARSKHHRQLVGTRPSPVPEERDEHGQEILPSMMHSDLISGRSSIDTERSKNSRPVSMRKSVIIQSSSQRSRASSNASVGSSSYFSSRSAAGPPYPVPDRGSSRKLFSSRSEGSSSPTPKSGIFSRKRGKEPIQRKDSLRKVKSATTIQRNQGRNSRTRSTSPTIEEVEISHPPLPTDQVLPPVQTPANPDPLGSPSTHVDLSREAQVVDSIHATMVGDWMWKYVRRRSSFGVQEGTEHMGRPGTDGTLNVTGNGTRHKRWVWLSPYDRAIMWSSKQPTSNSALMGKSGRKLIIQSVLDVRDDTPLPKNHGILEPFNRSILVLTPARALKFTAMSREKHFIWVTALSFLAHAHSDLVNPTLSPSIPEFEEPVLQPLALMQSGSQPVPKSRSRSSTLKRGGIRDSVRIAKDRVTSSSNRSSRIYSEHSGETEDHEDGAPMPPIPSLPREPYVLPASATAAEPPSVPRYTPSSSHGRKRSLTGPSRIHSSGKTYTPTGSTMQKTGSVYHDYSAPPQIKLGPLASPTLNVDWGSDARSVVSSGAESAESRTIRVDAFINDRRGDGYFEEEEEEEEEMYRASQHQRGQYGRYDHY